MTETTALMVKTEEDGVELEDDDVDTATVDEKTS